MSYGLLAVLPYLLVNESRISDIEEKLSKIEYKLRLPYPFVIVYREDEYAVAVDGKTKEVIARSTDHTRVIQKAIDSIDGGTIYIARGTYRLTSKITIPATSIYKIVGTGAEAVHHEPSYGTVIEIDDDIGFEFNANGDWNKSVMFLDLVLKGVYATRPVAIHYIDSFGLHLERVTIYNADILIESVNYWCEGVTLRDVKIKTGKIEYRKTGGTGSWGYARFDNVFITPPNNEEALLVNGGSLYRTFLHMFIDMRGSNVKGIRTINDGAFRDIWGYIVTDAVESGNYLFYFESGGNIYNDIRVPNQLSSDHIYVGNWADGVKLAGIYRTDRPMRIIKSVGVGVNDMYGDPVVLGDLAKRLPFYIEISVSGVASGETVTVRIEAVYNPDNVRFIEKSFTADGNAELTPAEIASLAIAGWDINPLKIQAMAKSDQASTSASVSIEVAWL